MKLVDPWILNLLGVVAVVAVWYWAVQSRHRRAQKAFGIIFGQTHPDRLMGRRRHVPALLYLSSLAVLIVAIARPTLAVSVPKEVGAIVLAMDVSTSMEADDFKPTRMEAAKAAAQQLVEKKPEAMAMGLISFSDTLDVLQTPTTDRVALSRSISRLHALGGTAIGDGMALSLQTLHEWAAQSRVEASPGAASVVGLRKALPPDKQKLPLSAIILLTDGENNTGEDPVRVAMLAAGEGIRVYTVGIGSPEGVIHFQNMTLPTRLDEALLKQIAETTQGKYFHAQNEKELSQVYDALGKMLISEPEALELSAVVTGLAAALFLFGALFSFRWGTPPF